MEVVCINSKGGVGKSTVTCLLALALAQAGKRVSIRDLDPQQTATNWINGLGIENPAINLDVADVVIVDTPPRPESKSVGEAIKNSDKILLIASPSPADLWSTKTAVELLLSDTSTKKKARLLFNKVQSNTVLGKAIWELEEVIGLKSLNRTLSFKQSYARATIEGWKALRSNDRDEVLNLALEVFT